MEGYAGQLGFKSCEGRGIPRDKVLWCSVVDLGLHTRRDRGFTHTLSNRRSFPVVSPYPTAFP